MSSVTWVPIDSYKPAPCEIILVTVAHSRQVEDEDGVLSTVSSKTVTEGEYVPTGPKEGYFNAFAFEASEQYDGWGVTHWAEIPPPAEDWK